MAWFCSRDADAIIWLNCMQTTGLTLVYSGAIVFGSGVVLPSLREEPSIDRDKVRERVRQRVGVKHYGVHYV